MCDALTVHRLSLGKETKPHNYTNEFNMINSIVLGMTAKAFRKIHDITGDIRNHLNEQQLSHIILPYLSWAGATSEGKQS